MIPPPDVSWNTMYSEIEILHSVSPYQRDLILTGWNKLALLLGEDWPENAQEQRHPWIKDWYNKAPWVKAFYGHIGHQLSRLEKKEHFDAVLDRLKSPSPNSCFSAQAEINAAWKLEKSKILFELVKPSQRKKSFDIRAQIDRREVGIEVSILGQSQKFQKQFVIFRKVAISLMSTSFSKLEAAGQIHRMLSQPHADHLVSMIEKGKQEALKEERIVLIEEDAFEVCITPKGNTSFLRDWKLERGMNEDNTLNAPSFDTSYGTRLHAKIQTKSKQIPAETPGIIYLEGIPIDLIDKEPMLMVNFANADIEEAVYENTNLLFVVLNSSSFGWGFNRRLVGRGMYVSRTVRYRLLADIAMIVSNRFHQFPKLRHKGLVNAFLC